MRMPTYYHLDTGISSIGQHPWELGSNLLGAARKEGFHGVMVSHRSLNSTAGPCDDLPEGTIIRKLFRCEAASIFSLNNSGFVRWPTSISGFPAVPYGIAELLGNLKGLFFEPKIGRVIANFHQLRNDLFEFFSSTSFSNDDLVLLATTNEFECLALAAAVRSLVIKPTIRIGLYFHFGVFSSPKSSMMLPVPKRLRMMQRILREAIRNLEGVHLNLFATSQGVAEQITAISDHACQYVPYPVSSFYSHSNIQEDKPKRICVTVAGAREEQVGGSLEYLIRKLFSHPSLFENVDIAILGSNKFVETYLDIERELLKGCTDNPDCLPRIIAKNTPLSTYDYRAWLANSDLGVLLYDRDAYRHRASGIFLELLTLGKPVIVPSMTTMSRELDGLVLGFYSSHLKNDMNGTMVELDDSEYQIVNSDNGQIFGKISIGRPFVGEVDHVVLTATSGRIFARCPVVMLDPKTFVFISPTMTSGSRVRFGLVGYRDCKRISITNAKIRVRKIDSNSPLSAVGLKVCNNADFSGSILEMIQHLDHYRETAYSIRSSLFREHDAVHAFRSFNVSAP